MDDITEEMPLIPGVESTVEQSQLQNSSTSSLNIPFLNDITKKQDKEPTPLPQMQLFSVLLTQFCEPVTGTVIYPFVVSLVNESGKSDYLQVISLLSEYG